MVDIAHETSMDLSIPPAVIEQENVESSTFAQHQHDYLERNKYEIKPLDTGPYTVAIVSRAYRELSNGNLAEKLLSLASLEIPASEIKAYIAVNNIRAYAMAAEVWDKNKALLESLPANQQQAKLIELVKDSYAKRGIKEYPDDLDYAIRSDHNVSLEKRMSDYRENQATLTILRTLTWAVNTLHQNTSYETDVIESAQKVIKASAKKFLSEGQLQTLLLASRTIMERGISIMGVDCSSINNASIMPNHGKATNEAAHIAFSQGAKYIDISDMDEFHSPTSLNELLALSQNENVDVLVRPLTIITPTHPEDMIDSSDLWTHLVHFYFTSYNYMEESYGNPLKRTSGTQIVSARTFRKYEYPERNYNEDFDFADMARMDKDLLLRFALESDLLRARRGRDVSWDDKTNRISYNIGTIEDYRAQKESYQTKRISRILKRNAEIEQLLAGIDQEELEGLPKLLQLYREKRKLSFAKDMKERIRFRKVFLGIEENGQENQHGILPAIYHVWQENPTWNDEQIMQVVQLSPRRKAFLEKNPLLLKAVMQEIRRVQNNQNTLAPESESVLLSLNSIKQHIIMSLPELFAEPLREEPSYDAEEPFLHDSNQANWMQIFYAERWIKAYISNLAVENRLSEEAKLATKAFLLIPNRFREDVGDEF